jgi:hypothetical protein
LIGDLGALLEIHPLEIFAVLSQMRETNIGELMASGTFECAQQGVVIGQRNQRLIGELTAL